MKMGPTSGKGSPDRFAVHQGRIYVFASDACYQWFVLDPERFIDRPDRWEEPTPEAVREGKASLDRAITHVGGAERLRRIGTMQFKYDTVKPEARTEIAHSVILTYRNGATRTDYVYGEYRWSLLALPNEGYILMKDVEKTGAATHAFLLRSASHEPLYLLREVALGRAKYASLGASVDREGPFHRVRIFSAGAVTVLSIDATGRVRSAEYQGRSGPGIATVVKRYSTEATSAGLSLPREITTVVGGQPTKDSITLLADFRIDPDLPKTFFEPRPLE